MKRILEEAAAFDATGPHFVLETTKIVRENTRYRVGEGDLSIGQMVDDTISHALAGGIELLDICIHFEREDWDKLRQSHG